MEDKELEQEIIDCLPIAGPDLEHSYIDCDEEDIKKTVGYLVELVRKVEQAAYQRGLAEGKQSC